jgi:hypothetical protein
MGDSKISQAAISEIGSPFAQLNTKQNGERLVQFRTAGDTALLSLVTNQNWVGPFKTRAVCYLNFTKNASYSAKEWVNNT